MNEVVNLPPKETHNTKFSRRMAISDFPVSDD